MDTQFENTHTFIPLWRPVSKDSDATADNLPGPGRNLGLLYALFGRKLEQRINSFASRRETKRTATTTPAVVLYRNDSIDSGGGISVDSDATADNLPGPGRNLGRLYFYLGNKLVNVLAGFLTRRGHGPVATAQAISCLRRHSERSIYDIYFACAMQSSKAPTNSERRELEKKCKKLVGYSRLVICIN